MDLTDLINKGVRDVNWASGFTSGGSANTPSSGAGLTVSTAVTRRPNLTPTEQYCQSIAVNAAVNAIAGQISKAKLRLFTRNGEEVNGGPAFDLFARPAPKVTVRRFIREIVCWYNIAGKYAVYMNKGEGGVPNRLIVLNPYGLNAKTPVNPRTPGDVAVWNYLWGDGASEDVRADYIAYDRTFNPDSTSIDGLSPLVVGGVQITGSVAAEKYNKQFFENGGIPSHVLTLPPGTPRQHREDFERRYNSEYGHWNSNSHKVFVVAGKDVDFKSLEQPFQDGAFMEMMKRADLKVGQLYRVPAINMGIYDKTRFDTANEERKLFLEETLMPECEAISECLQQQIVDVHFALSKVTVSRPRKPGKTFESKSLEKQFEKARSEREGSNLIVVIDTDTLPVANEVALSKAEYLEKLRSSAFISPRKAEQWVGLDFDDDRPERDEIYIQNNMVSLTNPKLNAMLVPGVRGEEGGDKKPGQAEKPAAKPKPKKELSAEDRLRKQSLKTLIHKLRTKTLQCLADGELWSLEDADALNPTNDKMLAQEIRKARHALRGILAKHEGDKRADAVKGHFDTLDGSYIRKTLGL